MGLPRCNAKTPSAAQCQRWVPSPGNACQQGMDGIHSEKQDGWVPYCIACLKPRCRGPFFCSGSIQFWLKIRTSAPQGEPVQFFGVTEHRAHTLQHGATQPASPSWPWAGKTSCPLPCTLPCTKVGIHPSQILRSQAHTHRSKNQRKINHQQSPFPYVSWFAQRLNAPRRPLTCGRQGGRAAHGTQEQTKLDAARHAPGIPLDCGGGVVAGNRASHAQILEPWRQPIGDALSGIWRIPPLAAWLGGCPGARVALPPTVASAQRPLSPAPTAQSPASQLQRPRQGTPARQKNPTQGLPTTDT